MEELSDNIKCVIYALGVVCLIIGAALIDTGVFGVVFLTIGGFIWFQSVFFAGCGQIADAIREAKRGDTPGEGE